MTSFGRVITGVLTYPDGKTPVEGAEVYVNNECVATTDENGIFNIVTDDPFSFAITFWSLPAGYSTPEDIYAPAGFVNYSFPENIPILILLE